MRLRIHGMTCGACVARVEAALLSIDGVAQARANLATETATVFGGQTCPPTQHLIQAVRQAGYDAETTKVGPETATGQPPAQRLQQQRQALFQALGLALPVIGLEHLAPMIQSSQAGGYVWWRVLQGILCALLLASSAGGPILAGGLRALIHKSPNMDLLVSLGVGVAFVSSLVALIVPGTGAFYFDAAAMIVGFITAGRYLETRARREASDAVATLAQRLPATAVCRRDGKWQTLPIDRVRVGDRVRVAPDTVVPVDGRVVSGSAAVDESNLTGESVPRAVKPEQVVRAGGLVREGTLTLEATAVGAASTVGRILRAVEDAQAGRTVMQRIADRVAGVFVPIVVLLAALTLTGWLIAAGVRTESGWFSGFGWAVRCAVAVLVIACPCAMGLATPMAVLVATGTAARRGILIRSAAALEAAGRIDTVLLDKTGTLTEGRSEVKEVVDEPVDPITANPREVLQRAASAEQFSQHPLARAIVAKAREWDLALDEPAEFTNLPGRGVRAVIDGRTILIGGASLLTENDVDLSKVSARARQMATDGQTVAYLCVDGICVGLIGLADTIRPSASRAVERLGQMGVRSAMITGDQASTAAAVAASVGVKEVHAELLPEQKLTEVRRLQEQGRRVAFVGDGINDAPALTAADVGVALATGTDVAVASADITLLGTDLGLIPDVIALARRSVRIIKQNLGWAFGYNLTALPLAALGKIPPGWAAAAMMASSISVVLNSLRLRNEAPSRSEPGVNRETEREQSTD